MMESTEAQQQQSASPTAVPMSAPEGSANPLINPPNPETVPVPLEPNEDENTTTAGTMGEDDATAGTMGEDNATIGTTSDPQQQPASPTAVPMSAPEGSANPLINPPTPETVTVPLEPNEDENTTTAGTMGEDNATAGTMGEENATIEMMGEDNTTAVTTGEEELHTEESDAITNPQVQSLPATVETLDIPAPATPVSISSADSSSTTAASPTAEPEWGAPVEAVESAASEAEPAQGEADVAATPSTNLVQPVEPEAVTWAREAGAKEEKATKAAAEAAKREVQARAEREALEAEASAAKAAREAATKEMIAAEKLREMVEGSVGSIPTSGTAIAAAAGESPAGGSEAGVQPAAASVQPSAASQAAASSLKQDEALKLMGGSSRQESFRGSSQESFRPVTSQELNLGTNKAQVVTVIKVEDGGVMAEWQKMQRMVSRSTNSSGTAMHLGGCNFGDAEAKVLSQLLGNSSAAAEQTETSFFSTLLSLNLEVNSIGYFGIGAIGDALMHNSCLHTLRLGRNKLGVAGVTQLAQGLPSNSTLTMLTLGGNNIQAEGAKALAQSLEHNNGIIELRLGGNNIGDDGAIAFALMLRHNQTLQMLHLYANHITLEGMSVFRDTVQSPFGRKLTVLNLGGNDCEPGIWVRIGELARLHTNPQFRARVVMMMLLAKTCASWKNTTNAPEAAAAEDHETAEEFDFNWFFAELLKSLHDKYLEQGFGQILF